MKKICFLIITLLSLSIIYVWDGYSRQKMVNGDLQNKYYKIKHSFKNKNILKHFTDDLVYINVLHTNLDFLVTSLYSTASVYFCEIKKGQNKYFLNELNSNSPICGLWEKDTKQKYNTAFKIYNNDLNETIEKFNKCALEGLDIVDDVCQKNRSSK